MELPIKLYEIKDGNGKVKSRFLKMVLRPILNFCKINFFFFSRMVFISFFLKKKTSVLLTYLVSITFIING